MLRTRLIEFRCTAVSVRSIHSCLRVWIERHHHHHTIQLVLVLVIFQHLFYVCCYPVWLMMRTWDAVIRLTRLTCSVTVISSVVFRILSRTLHHVILNNHSILWMTGLCDNPLSALRNVNDDFSSRKTLIFDEVAYTCNHMTSNLITSLRPNQVVTVILKLMFYESMSSQLLHPADHDRSGTVVPILTL